MSLADSDQATHGGYDYKVVGTTESDYICSICTKVLRDAHLSPCCGQHFCASCLTHWLGTQQRRKTCPHCQQEDHLQESCCYQPYEYEHCGHKDTHKAITGLHYSECPEYPLACPNRCDVTGIRCRAMPDHHSSCPLEPLDCPFRDAGCTEKIARKDMEDHMTENQQTHMLLTFQSLQQANQQVKQDLSDTKRELYDTKQELHDIKHNLLQSANGLCKVGDTMTFGGKDFPKLRKEMKVWHSPPFSVGDKVRVCLAVYPNGVKRGRWSHVSVSLILMEVVQKEEEMYLQYNVSVAAIGQHTSATLELCTIRWGDNSIFGTIQDTTCCANFLFPSPGEVL